MSSGGLSRRWLYLDGQGQQRGPIAEEVFVRLLKRGIVDGTTFIWAEGMESWKAVADVEAFEQVVKAINTSWLYLHHGEQMGPVSTFGLVKLFTEGEVDGLTMTWTEGASEWRPVGEIPELRAALQEANEQEAAREAAMSAAQDIKEEDQVFEPSTTNTDSSVVVAEDGKKYTYNKDTKTWDVVAGEGPSNAAEREIDSKQDKPSPESDEHALLHRMHRDHNEANGNKESKTTEQAVTPASTNTTKARNAEEEAGAEVASGAGNKDKAATDGEVAKEEAKKKKKKKRKKFQAQKQNRWVYVTGLPADVSLEELKTHFSRCGVIATDLETGEAKVKIYTDKDTGKVKGDGSVGYLRPESVTLAIQILDGAPLRGHECPLNVSQAEFKAKKDFVQKKKVKKELTTAQRIQLMQQQKALSWGEGEDDDIGGFRIVVMKNLFKPEDFEDPTFLPELEEDLVEECSKLGELEKVTVFEKNPLGVVIAKFSTSASASKCVEVMNGRFFAGKKIECDYWDGTDYSVKESEAEQQKRLEDFGDWLEQQSSTEEEAEEEEEEEEEDEDEEEMDGELPEEHAGRALPSDADW